MQHAANLLTLSRAALSFPLFFFAVCSADSPLCHVLALATFALIMASDAADGAVARRWGTVSDFGKEVDPFADKLVDAAIYIALTLVHRLWVLAVLTFVIIARHFTVTVLRGFAARFQTVIAARPSGKTRTAISFALGFLLLGQVRYEQEAPYWFTRYLQEIPSWLRDGAIVLLIALTLISLYDYLRQHASLVKRFYSAPNGTPNG